MTKKTPEQRIAELDAKRAKVEEKHKAEREAIGGFQPSCPNDCV